MNIENLCEGQVVKNYRVLCEILGQEPKTSNSKKAQLKEWECYFKYHKEGQKIIIDEIYDTPLSIEDGRTNSNIIKNINKGVYSKEMFPLVKEFVRTNDLEYHSKTKIMNLLGLKNNNYDIAYGDEEKVAEYLTKTIEMEITKDDIRNVLTSMWCVSQEKIDNAFKNLERLEYIFDYSDKLLCIWNSEINKNEVVIDDYEEIVKCIYEGKLQALADYFVRNPKKTMDDYIELVGVLKEDLDMEQFESIEKVNRRLNIELYLRGLGEMSRNLGIKIMHERGFTHIKTFYYAYSYMRNDDIEWEILDMAKKEIHIQNFKKAVKDEYLLNTFLDKMFAPEEQKINNLKSSDAKKRKFKDELRKHKQQTAKKLDILFDIFVTDNPKIDLRDMKTKPKTNVDELPF